MQLEKTYVRDIWGLLPKDTDIRESDSLKIDSTRITEIEGEVIVSHKSGIDYGVPTTARAIANIDALDLLEKYPKYKKWFETRGLTIQKVIEGIEEEHQENLGVVQGEYKDFSIHKGFEKKYNENEKTLNEFYTYLAKLSPLAKKAFISALVANRGKKDKIVEQINRKLILASNGEVELKQADLSIHQYESMDELNHDATIKANSRNERLNREERSSEESKFDMFRAREDILQESWRAQKRLSSYHYRVHHQGVEIDAIKEAVEGIPFVGKKLSKKLNKEDIEK